MSKATRATVQKWSTDPDGVLRAKQPQNQSATLQSGPTFLGTMVDGRVVGVAIADTPKPTKATPVDGDDMTWDWWQALGDAGYFTVGPDGGLDVAGHKQPIYYMRTGPQRLEDIVTELVQRVETLEATIRELSAD